MFFDGGTDSDAYTFAPGSDGGSVALIDFIDPEDGTDAAAFTSSGLEALQGFLGVDITAVQSGNTVTYFTPDGDDPGTDPDKLFELTVDDSGWSFEIFQDLPFVTLPLLFPGIEPGAPKEAETLGATTASGLPVIFDGLLWSSDSQDLDDPAANLGAGDPADDINANDVGFGIKNDQASQINNLEGFSATFGDGVGGDPDEVAGLTFEIEGIGNIAGVTVEWLAFDDTNGDGIVNTQAETDSVISGSVFQPLPNGNNSVEFTIEDANSLFDTVYVRFITPDGEASDDPKDWNDGVRILNFNSIEPAPIPDLTLSFEIQGTDGDGDTTQVQEFDVFITDDGSAIA
jgi:hypothetical protein